MRKILLVATLLLLASAAFGFNKVTVYSSGTQIFQAGGLNINVIKVAEPGSETNVRELVHESSVYRVTDELLGSGVVATALKESYHYEVSVDGKRYKFLGDVVIMLEQQQSKRRPTTSSRETLE
jgi:hypothetical protein